MRRIKTILTILALAIGFSLGTISSAQAFVCHDDQPCDCSIVVLGKTIVQCNQ